MYFSARAEGRISYGHLGRTNLFCTHMSVEVRVGSNGQKLCQLRVQMCIKSNTKFTQNHLTESYSCISKTLFYTYYSSKHSICCCRLQLFPGHGCAFSFSSLALFKRTIREVDFSEFLAF